VTLLDWVLAIVGLKAAKSMSEPTRNIANLFVVFIKIRLF